MGPEKLQKLKLKKKKMAINNRANHSEMKSFELFQNEEHMTKGKGEKKKKKSLEVRKRSKNLSDPVEHTNVSDESEMKIERKKKIKALRNKKRKNDNIQETKPEEEEKHDGEMEDGIGEKCLYANEIEEQNKRKARKAKNKKRRNEKGGDDIDEENFGTSQFRTENQIESSETLGKADIGKFARARKAKKARKAENVQLSLSKDESGMLDERKEAEDDVYQISSGDEDSSKGMKKWITEYRQSRPGLKVLQEKIDDFITAHEEREEQAKKEREAQAADGGWTVVVHHKGRKKTTDTESRIAVGSVAPAAVLDKLAKKKNKDVGLDFYRFQKREAHRNEIMMLQSKFEQDKKRIQELRAQRKFRPY